MGKNFGLILAGGVGKRMRNDVPKQFSMVYDRPVISYVLKTFNSHKKIDGIAVVAPKEYLETVREIAVKYNFEKVVKIIQGDETRQKSAHAGLKGIREYLDGESLVLIHDAARALVSNQIISDNIKYASINGGAITAMKSTDTTLFSKDGVWAEKILDRNTLYSVQTPQTFEYEKIMKAHELALLNNRDYSDDSGLYMDCFDKKLYIVNGDSANFKITYNEDIELFKSIIYKRINNF